jgi:hypothetical protein
MAAASMLLSFTRLGLPLDPSGMNELLEVEKSCDKPNEPT